MKTNINVICGFLESGKTTLIQQILESFTLEEYERVVVLSCEEGIEELHTDFLQNVTVISIENSNRLFRGLFRKIQREIKPDLILIEYNGTWPLEHLLCVQLPPDYQLNRILFCAEAANFERYRKNFGTMMAEQLENCDAVLFNRCSENSRPLKASVHALNPGAKLFFDEVKLQPYLDALLKKREDADTEYRRVGIGMSVLFALICVYLAATKIPINPAVSSFSQGVNTIFLGVLVQAIPFLLIGVFVSSVLQFFVSDEKLAMIFTKHPLLGFPLAVIMGVFFPVCDCAMVPIASRLIRKGVPLPQTITFMLASPAVNPISILATLYAFPGHWEYALYRVGLGSTVSLVAGLLLAVRKINVKNVLLAGACESSCSSGSMGSPHYTGTLGKAESVFRHAGAELFNVGRFIVCGAFLSAVLQMILSPSVFLGAGKNIVVPLLIMLTVSCVLSVCSSSNAFIARSFLNAFPLPAVLGFIVMGPMLDLSNLFMLGSSFQKKFIIRLAGMLFVVGFFVFLLFSFLYGSFIKI